MRQALVVLLLTLPLYPRDLRDAVILLPANSPSPLRKAAQTLSEEIAKRTQITLPIANTAPTGPAPVIRIATVSGPAQLPQDGFHVQSNAQGISVTGNDPRGALFGVGYLLRHLRLERQIIEAPDALEITSAPRYPLRGHQLGYRPKVNTYDAWTPAQYEQYIRDLAIFGTNAIELMPPRTDDDDDSPHFLLPKIEMMRRVSQICADYGLEVWIWYPAMDKDYSDPATVTRSLTEWADVVRQLPRVDAIFVPGGDPGHTRPQYLMALLEKQTESLRRFHPKLQMWMSPQSFSTEWMTEWFTLLNANPSWLTGVVYGPQVRIPLAELRAKTPARYPLRRYPDITHSRHAEYPVPDWDLAFASTEGREVINPRPTQQAAFFHTGERQSNGFITYSEGSNDDVNKFIWSGLGWNPDTSVIEILRDFSRYFVGERLREPLAQGLLALERNWMGPLLTNGQVDTTLRQFQAMERTAPPQALSNWRFQQALYRAYYDAFLRARLLSETGLETEALQHLTQARRTSATLAIDQAQRTLDRALTDPPAQPLRARTFELAEALFQSIGMQLSVPRYKAEAPDRGANLDMIDIPLNNRGYLTARFAEIRKLPTEPERVAALDEILNWTNPGPGGFYDNLGDTANQPHLVAPAQTGFAIRGLGRDVLQYPRSWWKHAEALYDAPLEMLYPDLDPQAQYKLKIVYAGDSPKPKIRLTANNSIEIHPLLSRPVPFRPLEFEIPVQATVSGTLRLTWHHETGLGDAGRGLQIAEVWLIRK